MAYMWDERYAAEEYVYGTEPNVFFKQEIDKLKPGKLLLPAEGEGRNAVYAAQLGWDVHAFDLSIEGQKKAFKLAKAKEVTINYQVIGLDEIELKKDDFDLIFLCYLHVPQGKRNFYHTKVANSLKHGGQLLLEGFSKEQINNNTGGPRNLEMLFSSEELEDDFKSLYNLQTEYKTVYLDEGDFHAGESDIVRLSGEK